MKKLLILFTLFFCTIPNFAQHDYIPMAVEDATYLFYTADYDFFPPWEDYYFGYKIKGDIEIDGQWYKKVYYRIYCYVNPPVNNNPGEPPLYICDEYLIGAIRDDIPNKKVYAYLFEEPFHILYPGGYLCDLNTEILLFDFDMNVGNNFSDFCIVGYDGHTIELSSVQVDFFYNANRLIYYLTRNGFYYGYIYEGIGSDSGLFDPIWDHFEAPTTTLLAYCIDEDEGCLSDYLLSNEEYTLSNSISIYPNPATDIIHISVPDKLTLQTLEVYDVFGKILLTESDSINKVNISQLTDGIYFVKVQFNRRSITKKIIKKSSNIEF